MKAEDAAQSYEHSSNNFPPKSNNNNNAENAGTSENDIICDKMKEVHLNGNDVDNSIGCSDESLSDTKSISDKNKNAVRPNCSPLEEAAMKLCGPQWRSKYRWINFFNHASVF